MKIIIKKIGNWINVDEHTAISKTVLPFGFYAVCNDGDSLSFTRRNLL